MQALNLVDHTSYAFVVAKLSLINQSYLCICYDKWILFTYQAQPEPTGPLHDPVTWYKITHAGAQVAKWDFQNKGRSRWTGASCIVLEVPLCNLHTSICDFVPCDRIVQRAYWTKIWFLIGALFYYLIYCLFLLTEMPNKTFIKQGQDDEQGTHVHFKAKPSLGY